MSFFTALSFLSIIPRPFRGETSAKEIERSLSYFPVVGVVLGIILAGLNWLLGLLLPTTVVYGLLLVALVIITGGMHLDGFADTCDGIAGHKTAEERLRIMRDSRVGAFGAIGIFLLLLIKYVSLTSVPESLVMTTLVLMPVVSRWAMVYAIVAYPYARPTGLGQAFKQGATWLRFTIATIITLAVSLALTHWANITYFYLATVAIILGVWVVTLGLATYLKRKFAGLSGDTYGAINEVAEVMALIIFSLLAQNHWFGVSS